MDTTIQNNLLPGEEILWEGRPQISNSLVLRNAGTSIFGVFWLAFSLFWTITAFLATRGASSSGSPNSILSILFPMFGLPFVAIGIYMVFAVPLKQRAKNKSIFYYLTNKRVIINIDTKSPTLNSILIADVQRVQIIQNRDGTGNIIFPSFFTNQISHQMSRSNSSAALPSPDNCFYRIESADDVYKLILTRRELENLQ